MFSKYQYHGLSTKSTVRLIKLEESKVQGLIACTIRHAEQADAEYDALSYTWGDPETTRNILIYNDTSHEWNSFPIHKNLSKLLDDVWQRKKFDRWLWTDRICLNQDDETEKNEQIPRMADIYHNAVRVIAWLGLEASQGEDLLPLRNFIETTEHWLSAKYDTKFPEKSALASTAVAWAEYWERVWIIQELVSAKEVVCFIGTADMTLNEMQDIAGFGTDPKRRIGESKCLVPEYVKRGARSSEDGHGPKIDLWRLLSFISFESYKSQRPHDCVYGILGLAAPLRDGTSPLEQIEIDYNKPPADVFLDAILESHPGLSEHEDYGKAIDLLLERPDNTPIWEPIFTFLKRYSGSNRTSQRHRELAKIVVSVSDAFYFIASTSGSPPGNWFAHKAFRDNFLPAAGSAFFARESQRTARFNAVVLGVALSFEIFDEEKAKKMYESWMAERPCRDVASSPWRCAAHQLSVRDKTPFQHIDRPRPGEELESRMMQDIERFHALKRERAARSVHAEAKWGWLGMAPFETKNVCSGSQDPQCSRNCDGSLLLCEFPEAKFGLQLSSYKYSGDRWRTKSIHLSFGL